MRRDGHQRRHFSKFALTSAVLAIGLWSCESNVQTDYSQLQRPFEIPGAGIAGLPGAQGAADAGSSTIQQGEAEFGHANSYLGNSGSITHGKNTTASAANAGGGLGFQPSDSLLTSSNSEAGAGSPSAGGSAQANGEGVDGSGYSAGGGKAGGSKNSKSPWDSLNSLLGGGTSGGETGGGAGVTALQWGTSIQNAATSQKTLLSQDPADYFRMEGASDDLFVRVSKRLSKKDFESKTASINERGAKAGLRQSSSPGGGAAR